MKIALIGKNGSGKSVLCDWLSSQGYSVISLSDQVRDELTRRHLPHTRDNLVTVANELKTTNGASVLAKRAIEHSEQLSSDQIVFDSVRHPDEVILLQQHAVQIVGIDAPIHIRYDRIRQRNRASDQIDFKTFEHHDNRENSGQSSGQHINQCLQYCDIIFQNDRDIAQLTDQVSQWIMQWDD